MTALDIIVWIAVFAILLALALASYFWLVTRRIARAALRLVPPPGKFIDIDGNRIHYVLKGQGRPIVFIHGLGGTQFHFSKPLFGVLNEDFRLVALDRPGSGFSTRRGETPASPSEQAAFIMRFADALGLDRPLLVGHSMGGAIALAAALDFPEKVAGLALISPLTRHSQETGPEFAVLGIRRPWRRRLIAETVSAPNAAKMAPATLAYVFGPQQPPEDYAVSGGAMIALLPSHFYASSTDFMAVGKDMPRQETRYGELKMPVGILFGDADRALDFERQGRWMAGQVEGLDLEILEGVGHMPQYAEPERVAAFIRRIAARAFAAAGEDSSEAS